MAKASKITETAEETAVDQASFQFDVSRWAPYAAKAVIALGIIYLVAKLIPNLTPLAAGLCWAVLSAAVAIGIAYPFAIGKLLNNYKFEPGGVMSRLNNGRVFVLIASFVLAAIFVACLIFEITKWTAVEWAMAILVIPVYMGLYSFIWQVAKKESHKPFRVATTISWSSVLTAVLLSVIYLVVLALLPAETYTNATEAFLASGNPFDGASSALLREGGKLAALVNGLFAYAMSAVAQVSFRGYVVAKVLIAFSTFASLSAIMGLCVLEASDIRRVFTSVYREDAKEEPLIKRYVAVALVLPVCLAALFLSLDGKAAQVVHTQEYSAVDQVIRNNVGLTVCIIDGKTYDYAAVQDFLKRLNEDTLSLGEEAAEELTPLINAAFDQRIDNVDAYLDWYYSLTADYECLDALAGGSVEDFMANQLATTLNEGVDDTLLNERIAYYADQAEALEAAANQELAAYEVDVPEWLIQAEETVDLETFEAPFNKTERLKDMGVRVATGGVAAIFLNKTIGKKIVGKLATKLALKLGISSTEKIASTAFVAGGIPGMILKFGADIVTTIILDGALLMADEMMNRDEYRQELVEDIEAQRAEMLALVGGTS